MAKSKPIPKGLPEFKPRSQRKPVASRMYKQPVGPGLPGSPEGSIGPDVAPFAAAQLEKQRAGMKARTAERTKRKEAKIAALKEQGAKRVRRRVGAVGLGALAAIGGVVGTKAAMRAARVDEESLLSRALFDIQAQERTDRLNAVTQQAQAESYEDSIQRNLARIQQYAPELYMQVAAGRRLPQGAVVLGGAPRQDLLNELGRAMSDGRFAR